MEVRPKFTQAGMLGVMERASRELDNEVGPLASCFGLAGLDEVPGPVLVRLLTLHGRREPAARSTIARQRRRGVLATRRDGRLTFYRLTGSVLAEYRELSARGWGRGASPQAWDGTFRGLLFHAPETERDWRDVVRRVALARGYRLLRPGLLVHVVDRSADVAAVVPPAPGGCQLLPVELRMAPDAAARESRTLWELDAVAGQLRAAHADLATLGTPPEEFSWDDCARYTRVATPVYPLLMLAPPLPPELLGDDWPLAALVDRLVDVNLAWVPAVQELVRTEVARVARG